MFLLEVLKLATHTLNESKEFNGKITVSQRDERRETREEKNISQFHKDVSLFYTVSN